MTPPDPITHIVAADENLGRALESELRGRGATVRRTSSLEEDLVEPSPTHVFSLEAPGPDQLERVRRLVAACVALERAPRFVLLSLPGTPRSVEQVLRASGLPYTIARSSPVCGPGQGTSSAWAVILRCWCRLARGLGARQHARRHRPTDGPELAFGLAHAAFNYTTIDRVLRAEELRYDQANHDQHHVPATRRDHRH